MRSMVWRRVCFLGSLAPGGEDVIRYSGLTSCVGAEWLHGSRGCGHCWESSHVQQILKFPLRCKSKRLISRKAEVEKEIIVLFRDHDDVLGEYY